MKRRFLTWILILALLVVPVHGAEDYIKWVDFNVSYEAMDKALSLDIRSQEQDMPVSWIDLLALAACRTGGKVTAKSVEQAYQNLQSGKSPQELLGELFKYYAYYHDAYDAALGGLVGNYAILVEDETGDQVWKASYGLKASLSHCRRVRLQPLRRLWGRAELWLCPKAPGQRPYGRPGHPHCGRRSRHGGSHGLEPIRWLAGGHPLPGQPALLLLRPSAKDTPFAPGLQEGDQVQAGQVIGFMGRTGYSTHENVNNIETVHLHFGLELIFDESQKECNSEIWIDVYQIVRLLSRHRSSVMKASDGTWAGSMPTGIWTPTTGTSHQAHNRSL